ncbi:MAG: ABC transporter substrate-binding protein, partial [Gemmatimonadetes bacterium]|nr:ABC transporter substrate-binding protein [Gemmatimonadota bacterium]
MILAAGCAGPPADPGTLRLTWSSDPATLDPAQAVDVVGGSAVSLLYSGLVAFDRDGNVIPALASAWELAADGATYRFTIPEDRTASDGTPLDAAAVAASFRRLLSPETASPRAWVLERIRGAAAFRAGEADDVPGLRVTGPTVLEVELERPSASFLGLLAMPSACVVAPGVPAD